MNEKGRQSLEIHYQRIIDLKTPISHHMPALRELADQCVNAVEFGVKRGGSTVALLLGCGALTSYDIAHTKHADAIKQYAGDSWTYNLEDSRTAKPFPADLIFLDSLHTYGQVKAELAHWGDYARRFLAFHDTVTFGYVGADGETGNHDPDVVGIMPAIAEFMDARPEWVVRSHDTESHGLLVLERRDR